MKVDLGYRLIYTAYQDCNREQRKNLTQAERRLLLVCCEALKYNSLQIFDQKKDSIRRLILKLEASPVRKSTSTCKICKLISSFFKAIGNFLHLRVGINRLYRTIVEAKNGSIGDKSYIYGLMYHHVIKNHQDLAPNTHKILKGIMRLAYYSGMNTPEAVEIEPLIIECYDNAKQANRLKQFFNEFFIKHLLNAESILLSIKNYMNTIDEVEDLNEIDRPEGADDAIMEYDEAQEYIEKDELIWINYAAFIEDQKDALKNAKFAQKKTLFKNYFKDHIAWQQKCFDPVKNKVVTVRFDDELHWMNHLEALGVFDAQDEDELEVQLFQPINPLPFMNKNIAQPMPKLNPLQGFNFQNLNVPINNFNKVDNGNNDVDNGNTEFPLVLKKEMLQAVSSLATEIMGKSVIEQTIHSFYKLAGKAQEVKKLMETNKYDFQVAQDEIGLLVHPEQHGQKDYVILGAPRILVNAYNKAKQNNDLINFFNNYFNGGCTENRTGRLQDYLSAEDLSNNIATNPPLIPLVDKKKKKLDYIYEVLEVFKDWTARDIAKEHQIKIDLHWVEAKKVEDSTKYKIMNEAQYKFDERCNSQTFIEFLKNKAQILGKETKEGAFKESDIQACVKQLIDNYDLEE